jgi:hypothetical protein
VPDRRALPVFTHSQDGLNDSFVAAPTYFLSCFMRKSAHLDNKKVDHDCFFREWCCHFAGLACGLALKV